MTQMQFLCPPVKPRMGTVPLPLVDQVATKARDNTSGPVLGNLLQERANYSGGMAGYGEAIRYNNEEQNCRSLLATPHLPNAIKKPTDAQMPLTVHYPPVAICLQLLDVVGLASGRATTWNYL